MQKADGPSFQIKETADINGTRLCLIGELDIAVADGLRDRLAALNASGTTIRLDLSVLQYIDSSGINVLIRARNDAADKGSELVVDPVVSRSVGRLFEVTGLDAVFWPQGRP